MIRYWLGHIWRNSHPVRFVVSRLLKRSRLCYLFIIRRDGYRLRFYPTSLSAAYWTSPAERGGDEKIVSALLKEGDVFVDVGANIGALSVCAASRVGPNGQVYSFEPHPTVCEYCRGNVALNGARQVQVFCCAIGDAAGTVRFSDGPSDDQNHVDRSGAIGVEIKRLDEVLTGLARSVTLLKIDVEGYELAVLRGAERLLSRVEAVYFESWERHYRNCGYSTVDIIQFLRSHAFEVHRNVAGRWQPVSAQYLSERCENLLALRCPRTPDDIGLGDCQPRH